MTGAHVGGYTTRALRSRRNRDRQSADWVSARLWRAVFAWSPVIALVGCAAGGWLLIRLVLISTGKPEYTFEPDIVVAGVGLLGWAGATLILLSPPSSVLARYYGQKSLTGVVWPLGRRFRVWNVMAVPFGGLLLGLLAVMPIQVWTEGTADLGNRLIITALFAFGFAVAALFLVRLGVCGVELTPTMLIARGYFFTRRYPRGAIENVRSFQIRGLAEWGMAALMNRTTEFYTVSVALSSGREKTLYASNSSSPDVEHGAAVIREWLAEEIPDTRRPDATRPPR